MVRKPHRWAASARSGPSGSASQSRWATATARGASPAANHIWAAASRSAPDPAGASAKSAARSSNAAAAA